ncbi:MAG: polyprenyl synthetase family protein, partial [Proteobacteria bacterium]|nr:polyprenyl synthetase family protein [Pseudomonadota bacterium]
LWDNKSSILVGDYLFARAFQLMVQVGDLAVLDMLSSAAATIAEGEVLQLSAVQNIATDEATYLRIITGKTAALFAASCGVGAILSGAGTASETALYNYGEALGMSFQIVDDVLDYDGNSADLGKNIGDDFREGKMTLPVIIALQRGDAGERVFWQRVMETGQQESGDFERAKELLLKYDALEETKTRARAFGTKAQESLTGLQTTGAEDLVQILHDQMDFVISRIS